MAGLVYRSADLRMWTDKKVSDLSINGERIWTWLLIGPFTTAVPGLILATRAGFAERMRMSPKAFAKAFGELTDAHMARSDWHAGVVTLPTAPRQEVNRCRSTATAVAWAKVFSQFAPQCQLTEDHRLAIMQALSQCGDAWAVAFNTASRGHYKSRKSNNGAQLVLSPNGYPNVSQDPEQEIRIEDPPIVPQPQAELFKLEAPPSILPDLGKAESKTQRAMVDRFAPVAMTVLAAVNAARKRVIPHARDIRATYASLAGICGRLDAGKTAEECLRVVEVCEREVEADARSAKWFDAVSPWVPNNFERKLAADGVIQTAAGNGRGAGRPPLAAPDWGDPDRFKLKAEATPWKEPDE